MSKHLFANEKVMKQYLGSLLKEEDHEEGTSLSPVAELLKQVPETAENIKNTPIQDEVVNTQEQLTNELDETNNKLKLVEIPSVDTKDLEIIENNTIIKESESSLNNKDQAQDDFGEEDFQALFFEVAGLTLAVPLKSLGGIHQLGELTPLFGKPKWFKGVMLNRDEKLSVVDTARWVMPEKFTPELEEKLSYKYLITLGDSSWGLLAESLVNNITLKPEDVKWRTNGSKRPWLAGVIKEKMCALLDVDNLNRLLEQGLDSQEQ